MSFEDLPDEILLIICSYLRSFDILQSFNDLNSRLNRTINDYRENIDLRELNLREFYFLCKLIRTKLSGKIHSIILSNSPPAVRQLSLFRKQIQPFKEILINLERLTLIDHYDDELDLYFPLISSFKHLRELKISFSKNQNESILFHFLPQIFTENFLYFDHLPKRRRYDLVNLEKFSLTGMGYLKLTPLSNRILKHLTIEIDCLDDLFQIFLGLPSLEYLNIYLKEFLSKKSDIQRDIQVLSLNEFHCQTKWQFEKCSFEQITSIIQRMPNVKHLSWMLISETLKENLLQLDLVNVNQWKEFLLKFIALLDFDLSIKCPSKSSNDIPHDFIRIFGKISPTSDRTIDIQMENTIKDESILEVDIQELHKITGLQLAKRFQRSQELTLYSDFFVDDEKIFATFPDSLLFPDRTWMFPKIRSVDFLGEFPHLNNPLLVKFIEQLINHSPNLQSIGFFLYWTENMTELVLNFLRTLQTNLSQIHKCYLYTEGDIDEKFISELSSLLPSLKLLSVKIDWYCNTGEVINSILRHMKDLNHLELVLEDIPDYVDDDWIERMKIEKDIQSLAMKRDIRQWLKRNTFLGKKSTNRIFQAEKYGNDLKIWF